MNNNCILIPTYNNHTTIDQMVCEISKFELPIIIVNDGSEKKYKQQLKQIENDNPLVSCIHRSKNGGKGAAVIDGIKWSYQNKYSHVLQIDADNQHYTSDIPKFLTASAKNPNALILGTPVFPENVSKARLWGRQISRFFVWIETLSFAISDPLFGFRLYPVADTHDLITSSKLGLRMDFDPEIAVKLYWKGILIRNIKTQVKYHDNANSNFNYVKDNILISWMHTRLFLGMIIRSPKLAIRWFK